MFIVNWNSGKYCMAFTRNSYWLHLILHPRQILLPSSTKFTLKKKMSSSSTSSTPPTVGLIIIGDEILKGQVLDTNTKYICSHLYAMGVRVPKISVIPDLISKIADEITLFSNVYNYVITTGGVGPTHDDLTYAGVAKAFDDIIVINSEMSQLAEKWLGKRGYSPEVTEKLCSLPSNCELIFEENKYLESFPIIKVRNVYIFPGIPSLVQKMFPRLDSTFNSTNFTTDKIYISLDEMTITPVLNRTVEKYPNITFGSYPVYDNLYYKTRITLESSATSGNDVNEAAEFMKTNLPPGSVLSVYDPDPITNATEKVYSIITDESHELNVVLKKAIDIIESALTKYDQEKVCICFNGGKDCTALLHLYFAVLKKKYFPNPPPKIQTLCIQSVQEDTFVEMDDFIQESVERYNLSLWTYRSTIHSGLQSTLQDHPQISSVLMGTRKSDPSGAGLGYFQMTDPTWPQVIRVSPLLDWTYSQVWTFLRSLSLPYCKLYDLGYTSVGSKSNTTRNSALAYTAENGEIKYNPAWRLQDCNGERSGRS